MFAPILLTSLLAAIAAVRADPNPTVPGPGDKYNEGATCHIEWDPDTTGQWKTMNIQLMSGSNLAMVPITTVGTVDGTDPAKASFDFTCPSVTPNAPIYFYQFSTPASSALLWTTRFTIADASGNSVPAPNATEPDGSPIPWGIGALTDPSQAVPPPGKGSAVVIPPSSGASSASSGALPGASAPSSVSGSGAQASAPASSGALSAPVTTSASQPSGMSKASGASVTKSSSVSASPTGATATNGASAFSSDMRLTQAAATLAMVALAYAVAL